MFSVIILRIYNVLKHILAIGQERMAYAQQADIFSKYLMNQEKMIKEFYEEKHNFINELIVIKSSIENEEDKEHIIKSINNIIHPNLPEKIIHMSIFVVKSRV